MKKNLSGIFIIGLLLFCLSNAFAAGKILKPENAGQSLTIFVTGINYLYYSLDNKESTVLKVSGGSELRIITRAVFSSKDVNKLNYSLFYSIDDGNFKKIRFRNVRRSTEAAFPDGNYGEPGSMQDLTIKFGKGSHTVKLKSSGKVQVVAKFTLKSKKEKSSVDWIPYEPVSSHEQVDIIINEEVVQYHRFSGNNPLKVKITGPARLKVFTRVENNYDMQGRVNYRIQVRQNGEVLNTYQVSSIRSDIAIYRNDEELVPGKAREFVIEVPKGKQFYEIIPMDGDTKTLLGRLFIPSKDIKIEE